MNVEMDEKKRGRPRAKNPKDRIVHARLTKKEYDALNEACATNNMSLTDVILTGLHAICVLSEK